MEQPKTTSMTQKAEQTRQRILDTALRLFGTKGYEKTTMRDIAAEAGCSLGLAYRYFSRKEEMVLSLYGLMSGELEAQVNTLPRAPMVERFRQAILAQFELMKPYRDALTAIFDATLNPRSEVGVFSERAAEVRRQSRNIFVKVVSGASDAPRGKQADHLVTIFYGLHLAMELFWLQDRSPETKTSYELLAFVHDMLALVRPLLGLPPVSNALVRLARIIGPMLEGDAVS